MNNLIWLLIPLVYLFVVVILHLVGMLITDAKPSQWSRRSTRIYYEKWGFEISFFEYDLDGFIWFWPLVVVWQIFRIIGWIFRKIGEGISWLWISAFDNFYDWLKQDEIKPK